MESNLTSLANLPCGNEPPWTAWVKTIPILCLVELYLGKGGGSGTTEIKGKGP